MKKRIALLLAVLMISLVALSACGTNDADGSAPKVKGKVVDAGNVSALCPDGWKSYEVIDFFDGDDYVGDDGKLDPNRLNFHKGAKGALDQFLTPGIDITYHDDKNTIFMEVDKEFYDSPEDLDPIVIGDRTWTGFTALNAGVKCAFLWTKTGDVGVSIIIWLEEGGKTISLQDADVQAILASIEAK